MGIFDFLGGFLIGAIIDPTSSYEEMQDKIEPNKEETINDSESVVPEDDFNSLVTDIMNDFDDSHDRKDSDVIIADDNDG